MSDSDSYTEDEIFYMVSLVDNYRLQITVTVNILIVLSVSNLTAI